MSKDDLHYLYELKKKKNKIRQECKKSLYDQCIKTIILYAKNNKYECIFEVPYIMFGLPKYNILDMIQYLITKLKNKGISIVILIDNNKLYINWYNLVN